MPLRAPAPPASAAVSAKRRAAKKDDGARGSRERLEVDERRAQLVRLGIDLFAARSYDEVSIDELARAARISKGLLYHYFPTKRDFYVATVREASRELFELTVTSDDTPPLERAKASLDAYLDYVSAHGPAYVALMRGGIGFDPEVARILDETRALMSDRMLAGLPGLVATPLTRIALRGWLGFCEATSLEWVEHRDGTSAAGPRGGQDKGVARDAVRDVMIGVLLAVVPLAATHGDGDQDGAQNDEGAAEAATPSNASLSISPCEPSRRPRRSPSRRRTR